MEQENSPQEQVKLTTLKASLCSLKAPQTLSLENYSDWFTTEISPAIALVPKSALHMICG